VARRGCEPRPGYDAPVTLSPLDDPALTVALALAAGMLGQSLARHLRIPGIVVLLAGGVLLGPDVLGLVRPRTLGPALASLVGFAVAVVLFEGGMNLDLKRLRREARSIRQMVTVGSVVTALGGAATARLLLGWSPELSLLFGTLVIVTGPTVITPLLRRIRVQANVSTVLEAEAVFGDAIGALIAVVALEVALAPAGSLLVAGAWGLASRLSVGLVAGVIGGWVIGALLRSGWVPEGLENVFTLALVLALYQATNALQPESGIVAVILAGLLVGNFHAPALSALKDFKEQLTVLFIGMLFVLLAADVRLSEVVHLGWPGVATVLALMFVVRPANVLAGTWGAGLGWREKAFMTWMSPRGIVAAAVSSHFATALTAAGLPGGSDLRALVFLVIAVTVVVQGLSGGAVAGLLRLRREISGFAILGANGLGRAYGELLREVGQEAIFLDSNLDACRAARAAGFRALHGSALAEDLLARAGLDGRAGCLALTANEEVNYLFARAAHRDWKVEKVWAAVRRDHVGVHHEMVQALGAHVLFGVPRSLSFWALRLERRVAEVERWHRPTPETSETSEASETLESKAGARQGGFGDVEADEVLLLPLALRRGAELLPYDETTQPLADDELAVAIDGTRRAEAHARLRAEGWEPAIVLPDPAMG
jgi:NhaP-type Na+/H+ or K+/H+ antiporter